jgi:hypothetical protein
MYVTVRRSKHSGGTDEIAGLSLRCLFGMHSLRIVSQPGLVLEELLPYY